MAEGWEAERVTVFMVLWWGRRPYGYTATVKSWDEDSFHASKCWFENAKKRTRIGESASVDHVASTERLEQFKKIIEERGYLQE